MLNAPVAGLVKLGDDGAGDIVDMDAAECLVQANRPDAPCPSRTRSMRAAAGAINAGQAEHPHIAAQAAPRRIGGIAPRPAPPDRRAFIDPRARRCRHRLRWRKDSRPNRAKRARSPRHIRSSTGSRSSRARRHGGEDMARVTPERASTAARSSNRMVPPRPSRLVPATSHPRASSRFAGEVGGAV